MRSCAGIMPHTYYARNYAAIIGSRLVELKRSELDWANSTMYQHWKLGSYIQIKPLQYLADFCDLGSYTLFTLSSNNNIMKSHKKVFQMKQVHVGTKRSKTSRTRWE